MVSNLRQYDARLTVVKIINLSQEPLPGEIICSRDQSAANPQIFHSDRLKILNLDFTIFFAVSFILLF